jgi:hypothetical protein
MGPAPSTLECYKCLRFQRAREMNGHDDLHFFFWLGRPAAELSDPMFLQLFRSISTFI